MVSCPDRAGLLRTFSLDRDYKAYKSEDTKMQNERFTAVGTNIQEKATMIWNMADLLRGPWQPPPIRRSLPKASSPRRSATPPSPATWSPRRPILPLRGSEQVQRHHEHPGGHPLPGDAKTQPEKIMPMLRHVPLFPASPESMKNATNSDEPESSIFIRGAVK